MDDTVVFIFFPLFSNSNHNNPRTGTGKWRTSGYICYTGACNTILQSNFGGYRVAKISYRGYLPRSCVLLGFNRLNFERQQLKMKRPRHEKDRKNKIRDHPVESNAHLISDPDWLFDPSSIPSLIFLFVGYSTHAFIIWFLHFFTFMRIHHIDNDRQKIFTFLKDRKKDLHFLLICDLKISVSDGPVVPLTV